MNVTFKNWIALLLCALIGAFAWIKLTYPQFEHINLSVSRSDAIKITEDFLKKTKSVNPAGYRISVIFISDDSADRYLQRTLGFQKEKEFLKKHHFDMFLWIVRYFKENQKEEFRLVVSAATGQITGFQHILEETALREFTDDVTAKQTAMEFLQQYLRIDFNLYEPLNHQTNKHENRTDYAFSWAKKDVAIPWSAKNNSGKAKLTLSAIVSGRDILSFSKYNLTIPDNFSRFIGKLKSTGYNLSLIFTALYISLSVIATYFVILRRNHLVMHMAKKPAVILTVFLFILSIIGYINQFEFVFYAYDTAVGMHSYLFNYILGVLIAVFLSTIAILMPALAGESLHHDEFPDKKKGAFLHYLTSTFFSRETLQNVLIGYLAAIILLGLQSALFQIGHKFLGVWIEHTWISELSSTYFPFITAGIIGFQASFIEEITFRIFATSWLKKLTKNFLLAVVISSVIWGFGHSHYAIFPTWFRGIEVSLLGIIFCFFYFRYGIICVLTAHFVFDVFWNVSAFIVGKTSFFNFSSSIFVLLIPLIYGLIAFLLNRPEQERKLCWKLNKHQLFNLDIIQNYLTQNKDQLQNKSYDDLKDLFTSRNWDIAVVETALENFPYTIKENKKQ